MSNAILEVSAILADPFHDCGLDEREEFVCAELFNGASVTMTAVSFRMSRSGMYKVLDRALEKLSSRAGRQITKDDLCSFVLERIGKVMKDEMG